MDILNSTTSELAITALNAYSQRHRVIAHNIAHHDAVGHRPLRLDFEAQLSGIARSIREGADAQSVRADLAAFSPTLSAAPADQASLDAQMAELARNTLQYETVMTALQRRGGIMKIAIGGRSY